MRFMMVAVVTEGDLGMNQSSWIFLVCGLNPFILRSVSEFPCSFYPDFSYSANNYYSQVTGQILPLEQSCSKERTLIMVMFCICSNTIATRPQVAMAYLKCG